MANFGRRTEHSWSTFMFTTYPDIGWVGGFTPLSGIILCIILAIIIICSMKWIRHGGHFQGPYSSCTRCVFDYKHVVLIGGGIVITPYASILQGLMAQFRASHIVCKHCQGHNYNRRNILENRFLKKVDFIWVNRDHKNFEWFLNILHEFEREQETYLSLNVDERRFLDIHLHFTGIKYDENSGDSPSDLITKFWSQITGHDVFTALKSKTHIGRPNWNELFQSFKSGENASMANDVGVFFCGPPSMGIDILKYCMNYQFRYFEEKF
ncbi:unnamed protein product [Adineta steineri]|uniref:Ferric reductase NAD binding domain-containing protein n=1 Tax=Adineta steineri TaxID=433720 RepID=A0A819R7M4_9BILA|nr:unnamed protein product [Adineta steineri]